MNIFGTKIVTGGKYQHVDPQTGEASGVFTVTSVQVVIRSNGTIVCDVVCQDGFGCVSYRVGSQDDDIIKNFVVVVEE